MQSVDRPQSWQGLLTLFLFLGLTACAPSETLEPQPEPSEPVVAEEPTVDTDPADGWIDGPVGRLRLEVTGVGEPTLVFVHGNGSNQSAWAQQVEHFARWYRVVTLDLRGFGESEAPTFDGESNPMAIDAVVADLETVVEVLDLPPFVLVGHSWGGAVVAAYAGKHPDKLAGLVFADVGGTWSPSETEKEQLEEGFAVDRYEAFTGAWFENILKYSENSTHDAVMDSLRATPRDVFIGAAEGLWGYEVETAQAPYDGPRCAIAAEFLDTETSIQQRIAIGHKVVLPNVSHWLMLDDPQGFNQALEDCLRLVEAVE